MAFYSLRLTVDSPLPPTVALDRIRKMVAAGEGIDGPAFRWRQILGWIFTERRDVFSLQPRYGDGLNSNGTRFVGTIEQRGRGSRIEGRVIVGLLTRAMMSIWLTAVAVAPFIVLVQRTQPAAVAFVGAAAMIGAGVLLIRYSLSSTRKLVEVGIRAALAPAAT